MKKFFVCLLGVVFALSIWGCSAPVKATEMESTGPAETIAASPTELLPELTEAVEIVEPEPPVTEPPFKDYEYFSSDVYYEFEYIENDEVMPHVFFKPSTAQDYEKIPLILWLHGSGEKNRPAVDLEWSGLAKVMVAWDFMHLEGMNAYIVAPHLVQGKFWSPYWCSEESANNVQELLNYYIEHYNVDPNQIVVAGHSLGGQGAVYMPQVLPETFCAMVPISVYNPCIPITNFDIPVWCFEGQKGKGEDSASIEYAFDKFARAYGEDRITTLPVGHGALPMAVFSMDNDDNLRTDLFEWMAEQMAASAAKAEQNLSP